MMKLHSSIFSIRVKKKQAKNQPLIFLDQDPEWASMMSRMYRVSQAYLLFCDLTNRASFEDLNNQRDQIIRMKDMDPKDIVILLVGTKCDLTEERVVEAEELMELAETWGVKYFETSAKERINVEEVFFEAVREIRAKTISPKKKKRRRVVAKCQLM